MRSGAETGIAALDTTELAATLRSDLKDKRRIQQAAMRVVRHHDALSGLQLASVPNDDFQKYVKERRARTQVTWHDRSDPDNQNLRLNKSASGAASTPSLPSSKPGPSKPDSHTVVDVIDQEEVKLRSLSKAKSEQFLLTLDKLRSGKLKNGGYTAGDDIRHRHQKRQEKARASSQRTKALHKSLMGAAQRRHGVTLEPDIIQVVHEAMPLNVKCPTLLQVTFCSVTEAFVVKGIAWKRQRLTPVEVVYRSIDQVIGFIRKRFRLPRSTEVDLKLTPLCYIRLPDGRKQLLRTVKHLLDEVTELLQTKQPFRVGQHVASGGKQPWLLRVLVTVNKQPEVDGCFVISGMTDVKDTLITSSPQGLSNCFEDVEVTQVRGQAYNNQVSTACRFVDEVNRQAKSRCDRWHSACLDFTKDAFGQWWLLTVRAASKLPQVVVKKKKRVAHLPLPSEPCPGEFCKSKTPALAKRIAASMLSGGGDTVGAKVKVCLHCFCAYHKRLKERREEEECRIRPAISTRNAKLKGAKKRREDVDLFTGQPVQARQSPAST